MTAGRDLDTLSSLLAVRAAGAPDALAFAAGEESLSYRRLGAAAAGLAGALRAVGVGPGDRVGLSLPGGLGFVRTFFALQHLGAVPCAFDPATPPTTMVRRLARLRPAWVLVSGPSAEALASEAEPAGMKCLAVEELDAGAGRGSSPPHRPSPEAPAFLQPTSGTSGEPRLALVSHRNALASLEAGRRLLGVRPDDVLVSWVPPWHDLGLMRFILGPVYFGVPCHLVPSAVRTLPLWLETIAGVGGTITGAPDFAYRLATRLVDPAGLDLSSLRFATDGGEAVRRSTILDFEERFGVPGVVRPGYGLAEATLGVTGLRAGEPVRTDAQGNVSCGRPLEGVEVRLEGSLNGPGEILVRGPAVFSGYFEAPEATAEALRQGWLHTGDVGALDDDGHLYVLGRRRALLKRGGVPLAPRELEEAAERLEGVRAAAAIAVPPVAGAASEEILLALERDPRAPLAAPRLAAAAAAAVERTIGFAPDRVVVLAPRSIPRTANGKTRYTALAEELAAGRLEESGAVLFSGRPPGS